MNRHHQINGVKKMSFETPIAPDRKQALQDWRATLTKEEDDLIVRMIEVQGEEYVVSTLGHLRNQLEIAREL